MIAEISENGRGYTVDNSIDTGSLYKYPIEYMYYSGRNTPLRQTNQITQLMSVSTFFGNTALVGQFACGLGMPWLLIISKRSLVAVVFDQFCG